MLAISAYNVVLAIHIMGVVIAFGVTFAYPIMFALTARHGPRSLPLMHRIELTINRALINGGLLIVLGAGIYLASKGHHWKEFFVSWGIGAVIVIGAVTGAVLIPTSKRARELAERDLAASGDGDPTFSEEYSAVTRRLNVAGSFLSLLVLVTIFFMATKP
ncbi:MAG: DUF2269 family protein [Solirubrobacterales bacterium]|nr:DUF2269 family protein [Solirubrobacterales bacterium]